MSQRRGWLICLSDSKKGQIIQKLKIKRQEVEFVTFPPNTPDSL